MAEIDKSVKLVFNEFTRAISEVPLEVYYQTITSDQYSANGFQFNIKQPGTNALLDCDIWMKYTFAIYDVGNAIRSTFEREANSGAGYPEDNNKVSFRGGNVAARCLQNLSIQLNNTTLNVQPYKYMDVLNRIYVSNDMSEHEFSASGGRYDEGNHGIRHGLVEYSGVMPTANLVSTQGGTTHAAAAFVINDAAAANNTNTNFIRWSDHFHTLGIGGNLNLVCNMRPPYPMNKYWYNPGFKNRIEKFQRKCRTEASVTLGQVGKAGLPADAGANARFIGAQPVLAAGSQYWTFEIFERLPIPLFKMYSSDGNYGVIPNITQMQIQGNFLNNLAENLIRCTDNNMDFNMYWTGMPSNQGQLYLRWYTPPMSMAIPREISIPYPKINTWSVSLADVETMAAALAAHKAWSDVSIAQYNITLEAIPDLLLIYVKYSAINYTCDAPDDYLLELLNLNINIDNASGKVNQIQTIDLYQKWKKIIKHQDAKIIDYDEWRRYCCVACLQPEDYGCRYGPGYSNQTTFGVTATARNHHINPTIAKGEAGLGGAEAIDPGGAQHLELIITSIYNKSRLTIRADGTAQQDMTKMAAEFNMISSSLAPPAQPQLI